MSLDTAYYFLIDFESLGFGKYWKTNHSEDPGTWKYWKTNHSEDPGTWKYWKTNHSEDPGTWKHWRTNHSEDLSICLHWYAPFRVQRMRKNTFWELVPGKMSIGILELSSKQALFSKWLRRPNHYAHETRIEILSKTPVSILRDLSPRPQNPRNTSEYSFLAWMSM